MQGLYEDEDDAFDFYDPDDREETPDDYWEQQARLPLRQRSLGWWIEVGGPNVFMVLLAVVLAAIVLQALLEML